VHRNRRAHLARGGPSLAKVPWLNSRTRCVTDAHSVPDAITAYQEWLSEEMNARAEDARLLMSNGQKIIDASSRLLSDSWTSGSMRT
jgi:hypothetical protein